MLKTKQVEELLPRLRRIEGQVRGVARMVENRAYCISIMEQIAAVVGALQGASRIVLRNHVATCLREAMVSGNEREIDDKMEELVRVFGKFTRHEVSAGGPGQNTPPETGCRGRKNVGEQDKC